MRQLEFIISKQISYYEIDNAPVTRAPQLLHHALASSAARRIKQRRDSTCLIFTHLGIKVTGGDKLRIFDRKFMVTGLLT
jgi:hypothetical protein